MDQDSQLGVVVTTSLLLGLTLRLEPYATGRSAGPRRPFVFTIREVPIRSKDIILTFSTGGAGMVRVGGRVPTVISFLFLVLRRNPPEENFDRDPLFLTYTYNPPWNEMDDIRRRASVMSCAEIRRLTVTRSTNYEVDEYSLH